MAFLSSLFGSKPKIPEAPKLETAQGTAIQANIQNFADIAKLASQYNLFTEQQLASARERALPGGTKPITDLISSRLAGEIPEGTLRQLRRTSAERSAGALTGGSQFALGKELSSQLGLSLEFQNQGFNSAMQWLQATQAPTFDVSSMFVTPAKKYENLVDIYNRDLMKAKVEAAPDPGIRGLFDTGMQILGMVTSAYGGGPGYTGTYNPSSVFSGTGGMSTSSWNVGGGGFGFGRETTPFGSKWFLGSRPGAG